MKTLTGQINYALSYDDNSFKIDFQPTDELEQIKNSLASISFARIIAENTVKHMNEVKKKDRGLYNSLYKKNYHNATRLVNELRTIADGIMTDLSEFDQATTKVTVQNEITEE